ncbi:hypothetical protein G6F26_012236 [Rhizopus arrhizus]|nr:hypothetical protein G6F23_010538 [Rhizopus arrhizus]KAG0754648.1 hypothetical protein G6F24_012342 [Rhizopus arrhizus]KAG0779620.1 hypothetical protein G6F22_010534 [Rhizopus arrhizus]KAG0783822.1 hypothetical protein G6F21_010300 [Rhizopus arrhizus]KAG0892459.1 hypothetical protein G6F34_010828 [Rhizopus arrhizus]
MEKVCKNDSCPTVTILIKSKLNKCKKGNHVNSTDISTYSTHQEDVLEKQWVCHKHLLVNQSSYFSTLLGENFIESQAITVRLSSSVIGINAMNGIIQYIETNEISNRDVRDLCDMYSAADYLKINKLCDLLIQLIEKNSHGFGCYCNKCTTHMPELLTFCTARVGDERIASVTQKVINVLINDPDKSLSTFWPSRQMAMYLVGQEQDECQRHFTEKMLANINKTNTIEVHHACYLATNSLKLNDPHLIWSKQIREIIQSLQAHAIWLIANHFDFYCCQYPALLSCIDGVIYSIDFLEYLLTDLLENQMNQSNAGLIYQGIVCHLMSRNLMALNNQARNILIAAKETILFYVSQQIDEIRQQQGLEKLERHVLKMLARDLDVCSKHLVGDSNLERKHKESCQHQAVLILKKYIRKNTPFCSMRQCTTLLNPASKKNDACQRKLIASSNISSNNKLKKLLQKENTRIIIVSKRVKLTKRPITIFGTVAFIGRVHFAEGVWIGVELDKNVGENDGSVNGYRYFVTSTNKGIFVRPQDVSAVF